MADTSFEQRLHDITVEARDKGYAITWWSPEEVENVNADELINIVVERGNNFIEDTRSNT